MTRPMILDAPGGATIDIKVIPRAGRTCLAGSRDGAILVRLAAAPVDGEANAVLIAFLSQTLDLPRHRIVLIKGENSRSKRVKVAGLTATELRHRLEHPAHGR